MRWKDTTRLFFTALTCCVVCDYNAFGGYIRHSPLLREVSPALNY
jgi:hypothetical protein